MQTCCAAVLSLSFGISLLPTAAFSDTSEQRLANLLTFSEVALTTAVMLRKRFPDEIPEIFWTATFNETTWSLRLSNVDVRETMYGSPMIADWSPPKLPFDLGMVSALITGPIKAETSKSSMTFDGQTWMPLMTVQIHGILADADESLKVSFVGNGVFGPEPIYVSGESSFLDHSGYSYGRMDFSHMIKIGDHSWWGWIRGTELIVGGAIGAAGGVMATGATAGAAVVIGLGAALSGAASAVSISDVAAEYFDTGEDDQPSLPVTPNLPDITAETLVANFVGDYLIIEAALDTGRLEGSFPQGSEITGTFDFEGGIGSGEIK